MASGPYSNLMRAPENSLDKSSLFKFYKKKKQSGQDLLSHLVYSQPEFSVFTMVNDGNASSSITRPRILTRSRGCSVAVADAG